MRAALYLDNEENLLKELMDQSYDDIAVQNGLNFLKNETHISRYVSPSYTSHYKTREKRDISGFFGDSHSLGKGTTEESPKLVAEIEHWARPLKIENNTSYTC